MIGYIDDRSLVQYLDKRDRLDISFTHIFPKSNNQVEWQRIFQSKPNFQNAEYPWDLVLVVKLCVISIFVMEAVKFKSCKKSGGPLSYMYVGTPKYKNI